MRVDPSLEARLLSNLVGASAAFRNAIVLISRFARCKAPILIVGETGTGKELAAHAAHYLSDRSGAAFIPINCGALPDALIESELFGHAKGAFTDARRARTGLVREAEGGTLFFDEIEALAPRGQAILLRFLQDANYRAVGEEHSRHANVRIIAATNHNLRRLVDSGEFRADLLFRLDVLSIELPPLRERVDDIVLLVPHLLAKAAHSEAEAAKTMSPAAVDLLCCHTWPGNVRELEHVLLRAHLLTVGPIIHPHDLARACVAFNNVSVDDADELRAALHYEKACAVREVERRFVERLLARTNGNISEAARLCNMERAAFSRMAKKYRNDDPASQQRADALRARTVAG